MKTRKAIGLTKDAGWQFGIRRTFPVTAANAWDFLLSEGLEIWLGKVKHMVWEPGYPFTTLSGTEGVIRVFKPGSHMRMSWKKKGWDNYTMLQPRVVKGVGKCVISFHHDKLYDAKQRVAMKAHWEKVMDQIEQKLKPEMLK